MDLLCVSLSVREHISRTTKLSKLSVLVSCGRGSVLVVLLWRHCRRCYALPVLWMTSYFSTIILMARTTQLLTYLISKLITREQHRLANATCGSPWPRAETWAESDVYGCLIISNNIINEYNKEHSALPRGPTE